MVKNRNIFLVYLFSIITFGIYSIYWLVSTKNEMNSLGAKIPTALLLIIPNYKPILGIQILPRICRTYQKRQQYDNMVFGVYDYRVYNTCVCAIGIK